MARLHQYDDLPSARRAILATANAGGLVVAVAMLAEALTQMEILGPTLSAEVWSAYAAVSAAQPAAAPDTSSSE